MTVEPDFDSFMPQPTPAAPVVGAPPAAPDLIVMLADQQAMEQAVPQPVVSPAPALFGEAGGRAAVAASAGEQAMLDPSSRVDLLSAAERFAGFDVRADPMAHARIAAAAGTYAETLAVAGTVDPNGAPAAAQLDLAKVKHLVDTDGISDTEIGRELKQLWSKFQQSPNSLTDGEVSGLLDLVGQIGSATELLDSEDLSVDYARVDKVDLLPAGAVPRVRLTEPDRVGGLLPQVSGELPELSTDDDLSVHLLPDGSSVAVSAPNTLQTQRILRNLYPAIGNLWAPAKPRVVPDIKRIEQDLYDLEGATYETWPPAAWDDLGGHPALSGDVVVTAIVPEGQLPRSYGKLGQVTFPNGAGVRVRPQAPDEGEPLPEGEESLLPPSVSERARRVAIRPNADSDPTVVAAELEMLGARDVAVYAPGEAPDGWMPARESFFSDPAGTLMVVRSANADRTAPHGVNVWVRPGNLPVDVPGTERTPASTPAKVLARGVFQFGDVMVNAPRTEFERADLTEAKRPDSRLVGIGLSSIGGLPMLQPVFDGESESGFEAYARVDGRNLVVQVDPGDLAPAVRFGLVLGQAGVKPGRVVLEGAKTKRLFGA